MYSYQSRGVSRYIFSMSAPPNFALGVLITLVPRDFGGYHVGCSDGELIQIVNQIAINFDANLIRIIIFLSFGMHCFVSCNRKR